MINDAREYPGPSHGQGNLGPKLIKIGAPKAYKIKFEK